MNALIVRFSFETSVSLVETHVLLKIVDYRSIQLSEVTVTTNVQNKYKRAIEWCEGNRQKLPPRTKFRLMSSENLYKLLETFGAYWSVKEQEWRCNQAEANQIMINQPQVVETSAIVPGKALIRIIAHSTLIGKRVAELTELAEALNWTILKVSDTYEADGDSFVRVYMTVMCRD